MLLQFSAKNSLRHSSMGTMFSLVDEGDVRCKSSSGTAMLSSTRNRPHDCKTTSLTNLSRAPKERQSISYLVASIRSDTKLAFPTRMVDAEAMFEALGFKLERVYGPHHSVRALPSLLSKSRGAENDDLPDMRRAIKAQHWADRPQGWHHQTRSASGARFAPFEIGYDALDKYIPRVEDWLVAAECRLASHLSNPPETISIQPKRHGYPFGDPKVYYRPADFDVEVAARMGGWSSGTYLGQYVRQLHDARQEVKSLTTELAYLRERRVSWVTPPMLRKRS